MSDAPDPNHTHPNYEATFSKMLNVLENITVVLRDQVEQSRINQARHDAAIARHEAAMERIDAALERLTIKSAENEDKLNGLISLMDRHIREHDQQ